MGLFDNTIKQKYASLEAKHNQLIVDFETLTKAKTELETKLTLLGNDVVAKSELDKVTKDKEDLTKLVETLKLSQTDFDSKVTDKAIALVASQGIPTIAIKPSEQPMATNGIIAEYESTTDMKIKEKLWNDYKKAKVNQLQSNKQ